MKIKIDKGLLKSLLIMGSVVEARDAYTGGHLWRVSEFSKLLSQKTGLSRKDAFLARIGGFLHDIGKIGVPDAILRKRGPLDDHEYEVIKTHPGIGVNIIHEHPLSVLSQDVIGHHHEWYNGNGYPDGLAQDEISVLSRIVSITDAFDAMTSTRPYRTGMPVQNAVLILKSEMDKQFDGKLASYFLEISMEDNLMHIVGHSDEGIPLVHCSVCGPVIAVKRGAKDGDQVYCKVCGVKHRLHKKGKIFAAESLNQYGTPDDLKPEAEVEQINTLLDEVPDSLDM